MRRGTRAALVLATAVGGTAILLGVDALLIFKSDDTSENSVWVFLLGPAVLGGLVAISAGGRARWMGLGVAAFGAVGMAGLVWFGPEGRAEGGSFLVVWWLGTSIAGVYVTGSVIWLLHRRR